MDSQRVQRRRGLRRSRKRHGFAARSAPRILLSGARRRAPGTAGRCGDDRARRVLDGVQMIERRRKLSA